MCMHPKQRFTGPGNGPVVSNRFALYVPDEFGGWFGMAYSVLVVSQCELVSNSCCRGVSVVQAGNESGAAGWGEPSSSLKPQQAVPAALKPMLHECYAMFDLLLPYTLKPEPLPSGKAATGALAERLSASALHSPRLRPSLDDAAASPSVRHA